MRKIISISNIDCPNLEIKQKLNNVSLVDITLSIDENCIFFDCKDSSGKSIRLAKIPLGSITKVKLNNISIRNPSFFEASKGTSKWALILLAIYMLVSYDGVSWKSTIGRIYNDIPFALTGIGVMIIGPVGATFIKWLFKWLFLQKEKFVSLSFTTNDNYHHFSSISIKLKDKDRLIELLKEHGITTNSEG